MKKKIIIGCMMALCLAACSSCALPFEFPFGNTKDEVSVSVDEQVKMASVEQKTEDMVAIRVTDAEKGKKLIEVMQALRADEQLTFTQDSQGMVIAINGTEYAADWSGCWMLYTSDEEFSSIEWGVYEYHGAALGSAVFGEDALPVVNGEIYVWVYTKF